MNITPVILAFDKNFLLPALTTIKSAMDHCSDPGRIEFFIMHRSLEQITTSLIERFIHSYGFVVTFVNCHDAADRLGITTHDPKRPLENFFPLLIPTYFSIYEKVLFLDADLLVRADILRMIDSMPADRKLGVIRDTYHNHLNTTHVWGWEDYSRSVLKLKNPENYFNSGVILFNMPCISPEDAQSCLELVKNRWQAHDESILNHVFHSSLYFFPTRWNVNVEYMHLHPREFRASFQRDLRYGRKNPAICHFAGTSKPWSRQAEHQVMTHHGEYEAVWQAVKRELAPLAASILCGPMWDMFPSPGEKTPRENAS